MSSPRAGDPHATPSPNPAIRIGWWLVALVSWPVQYLLYVPIQCGSRLLQTRQVRPKEGEADEPLRMSGKYTPPPRQDFLRSWPELRPSFVDHLRARPR